MKFKDFIAHQCWTLAQGHHALSELAQKWQISEEESLKKLVRQFHLTGLSKTRHQQQIYARLNIFHLLKKNSYHVALESLQLSATNNYHINPTHDQGNATLPQISISHCPLGMLGALALRPDIFIGVDIEAADRKIAENSKKYFQHELDDLDEKNNLLGLWVIKEAAFKALHHAYFQKKIARAPQGLRDIIIKNMTPDSKTELASEQHIAVPKDATHFFYFEQWVGILQLSEFFDAEFSTCKYFTAIAYLQLP